MARKSILLMFAFLFAFTAMAEEVLSLDVISYEAFAQRDSAALDVLVKALYEKGIVGIRGVPGYVSKVRRFIETAREFSLLPEEIKEVYAPNHDLGEMFLGYEKGKEKFKRPDGKWVIDDLKVSYYAYVPENKENKWPVEVDLQTAFQELGMAMSETAKVVMEQIDLTGPRTGIFVDEIPQVGRLLYYKKSADTDTDNPYWCGAHFDHGVFTALTQAYY